MNKFIVRLPGGAGQLKKTSREVKMNSSTAPRHGQNTQLYLDMGQKSLGTAVKCTLCSMFYVRDDTDDLRSHDLYCKKVKKAPVISSLDGHQVVSVFNEKSESIIKVKLRHMLHRAVVQEATRQALEDLGSTADMIKDEDDIFMLLNKSGAVMGILVCEQVERERCALIHSSEETIDKLVRQKDCGPSVEILSAPCSLDVSHDAGHLREARKRKFDDIPAPTSKVNSDTEESHKAYAIKSNSLLCCVLDDHELTLPLLMGVKLIWVNAAQRRQAVARRLLDSARKCFVYGTVVSTDKIAFSQPTQAGFEFACGYCQCECVLAYV